MCGMGSLLAWGVFIFKFILGYEFNIDSGNATPVCCKKPHYGPHETNVIGKHTDVAHVPADSAFHIQSVR